MQGIRAHRHTYPYGKTVDVETRRFYRNLNARESFRIAKKIQNRKARYAKHDEFKVDIRRIDDDDT